MSKLTVTIPDDLHQQIRDELERQGITTSQFIEQAITTFFEKPKGVSNMATRTLAFQVSEELLQRIKTFLARYEQIYHRKLSQKEFLVHLIERELDEAINGNETLRYATPKPQGYDLLNFIYPRIKNLKVCCWLFDFNYFKVQSFTFLKRIIKAILPLRVIKQIKKLS